MPLICYNDSIHISDWFKISIQQECFTTHKVYSIEPLVKFEETQSNREIQLTVTSVRLGKCSHTILYC